MGGEAWSYFVPYRVDVRAAMEALKEREFAAGRYHSRREYEPSLPPPASLDDLYANYLTEEGSRSILDMFDVADPDAPEEGGESAPDPGEICTVVRLGDDQLRRLFGTTQPTREMIEKNDAFYDDIERGHGIYIVAYRDGRPDEIFFAGYSFD